MTIFAAFKQGFLSTWRYRRAWGLLYLGTLLLALLVAWPLQQYLTAQVGHSLLVEDLLEGIDYTVINDFVRHYGDGLQSLLSQSVGLILLYLLLFVFFWGGILSLQLQYPIAFQGSLFWGQSAGYFWRILRLSFYFWLLQLLVLGLFIWLYWWINAGFSAAEIRSEAHFVRSLYGLAPFYAVVALLLFVWQDYAKVLVVRDNPVWLTLPIRLAFRFITNNWTKVLPLYLLNLLIMLGCYGLYRVLSGVLPSVGLLFFWTQLFILGRLGLRMVNSGSQAALVQAL